MFEKVHSYSFRDQLIEEMEDLDNEVFIMPWTIHEKMWLKSLLERKEASFFLKKETVGKLEALLQEEKIENSSHIIEKCGVKREKLIQDESYRNVRDVILHQKGFQISYRINDGTLLEKIEGIPFKLEFLVHKEQWSVLWLPLNPEPEDIIYTPLHQITAFKAIDVKREEYQKYSKLFDEIIMNEKEKAHLLINQKVFQQHSVEEEKQRILYALACFEKELFYQEVTETYEIIVYYRKNEIENLLQKIRMLGRRIIIKSPDSLRERMVTTASNSLNRYKR